MQLRIQWNVVFGVLQRLEADQTTCDSKFLEEDTNVNKPTDACHCSHSQSE